MVRATSFDDMKLKLQQRLHHYGETTTPKAKQITTKPCSSKTKRKLQCQKSTKNKKRPKLQCQKKRVIVISDHSEGSDNSAIDDTTEVIAIDDLEEEEDEALWENNSNDEHGESSTFEDDKIAKEHIEYLRKNKFGIGSKKGNPLTQDLHHAVTCLSAELYTKDVHFLMELIQNAEDNQYEEDVEPTLEFALTKKDITGCGAPETLLVFNNEVGFSRQNMESICSVGRSTKKGKRNKGFIGEKGIGFKSVFLVSRRPHIVSNGYKVSFSEEPNENCGIGYIVPDWISDESFISKIQDVYGSRNLPTTTIVLPLKADKVNPVKEELSGLHPELLLFLSKLKRLYVHENSSKPMKKKSVTAISIASETNHVVSRNKQADSRVIHLSVKEKHDAPEEQCQYYIWRQAFPVEPEAKVRARSDVEEWTVSLAFPFGQRLERGTSSVGIFAFLPTSMVTNFPFVIQADFILASSRETIVLDSRWNQGILECVPYAFVEAFTSCVKEGSPLFTVAQAFEFLPVDNSPFPELDEVRETIQTCLADAMIVPCETFSDEVGFCKPNSAVSILPTFWTILSKLKDAGISLAGSSTMKDCLVYSSLDNDRYEASLDFLGVSQGDDWYGNCIVACDLVRQAPEDIYVDILYFFVVKSWTFFNTRLMRDVPLFKYIDQTGLKLCSVAELKGVRKVQYGVQSEVHAWLLKCNKQFGCPKNMYFLPNSTQIALTAHPKGSAVSSWLQSCGIKSCSAVEYATQLCDHVSQKGESNVVVTFCHFLYHSMHEKFLTDSNVSIILQSTPIIDGCGYVRVSRKETLVPASGSKWVKLFGSINPFLEDDYVDIGETYAANSMFVGKHIPDKMLLSFLMAHTRARDLPEISPPNMALKMAMSEMTGEQTFLLLDWIRFHRTKGSNIPDQFIVSIRSGKWMKTKSGVDCPSNCAIPNETGKAILEMMLNIPNSFSIVDEDFYGEQINLYSDELKFLGVRCGINGVQDIFMHHFEHLACLPMCRETAFSLLLFMGLLKERKILDDQWLKIMSEGRWVKTYKGYAAPRESVFLQSDWEAEAASIVTNLHVIDDKFYGGKFHSFADELKLLGVKSEPEVYRLATESISFPANPLSLTSHCGLFILKCLRNMETTTASFIEIVQSKPWLKTSHGFKCPSAAILDESDWACIVKIVEVPMIDEAFYGNEIRAYMEELNSRSCSSVWKRIEDSS